MWLGLVKYSYLMLVWNFLPQLKFPLYLHRRTRFRSRWFPSVSLVQLCRKLYRRFLYTLAGTIGQDKQPLEQLYVWEYYRIFTVSKNFSCKREFMRSNLIPSKNCFHFSFWLCQRWYWLKYLCLQCIQITEQSRQNNETKTIRRNAIQVSQSADAKHVIQWEGSI